MSKTTTTRTTTSTSVTVKPLRLNNAMRRVLIGAANSLVDASRSAALKDFDEKLIPAARKKLVAQVASALRTIFPQREMKLLAKYGYAQPLKGWRQCSETAELRLRLGSANEDAAARDYPTLDVDLHDVEWEKCLAEFPNVLLPTRSLDYDHTVAHKPVNTDARWVKNGFDYSFTHPLLARVSAREFIDVMAARDAIAGEFGKRKAAYATLVNQSSTLENVIAVWPEAEALRAGLSGDGEPKLVPEQAAELVRIDVAERAKRVSAEARSRMRSGTAPAGQLLLAAE